jgi:type II secretory pathway component PulF
MTGIVVFIILGIVVYIFGSEAGIFGGNSPTIGNGNFQMPSWVEDILLPVGIMVGVFVATIYFVVKKPKTNSDSHKMKDFFKNFGNGFKKGIEETGKSFK